jgi:hypothetical protein
VFDLIVFWLLALLLFLASGAALYLGAFRAGRAARGLGYKTFSGLCSWLISGVAWYYLYSFHYLSW